MNHSAHATPQWQTGLFIPIHSLAYLTTGQFYCLLGVTWINAWVTRGGGSNEIERKRTIKVVGGKRLGGKRGRMKEGEEKWRGELISGVTKEGNMPRKSSDTTP